MTNKKIPSISFMKTLYVASIYIPRLFISYQIGNLTTFFGNNVISVTNHRKLIQLTKPWENQMIGKKKKVCWRILPSTSCTSHCHHFQDYHFKSFFTKTKWTLEKNVMIKLPLLLMNCSIIWNDKCLT